MQQGRNSKFNISSTDSTSLEVKKIKKQSYKLNDAIANKSNDYIIQEEFQYKSKDHVDELVSLKNQSNKS